MADTQHTFDKAYLARALEDAHHPTLAVVLVHLTGETKYLAERYQPEYEVILGDPDGGLSDEAKAELRAAVVDAMEAYQKSGELPPPPDAKTLRQMMDYCATQPIPDEYVEFVSLELPLDGEDKRMPGYGIELDREAAAGFKMLIIGAGMSGLLMGLVCKQNGVDFEIIEKSGDVGGTWLDNTYPGCRVDGPNHLYSYSFEADHEWPLHFSTQDLLLEYFQGIADKYELRPHIRFNTEVERAVFDESAKTWTVHLKGGETATGNGLVSAVGQLNQPNYPDIPGRERFAGPSFHSARWDHSIDLKGKRVGVIGTGASAFQFIPEIAKEASDVFVFQRTPSWLVPTPDYHDEVTDGKNYLLSELPFYQVWFRFFLFLSMADGPLEFLVKDPAFDRHDYAPNEMGAELRKGIEDYIAEQVPDDPELRAKVTPDFHVSGRRSLRDNGVWIDTLKQDHVVLETSDISEITETGIKTANGTHHEFDVLIFGTGFKAADFLTPMEIVGLGGKSLRDEWDGDARAYLGITAPDFPNFFMMYGPNTNIVVNASIIFFSEAEANYILGCIKMLQDAGAEAFNVRQDVFEAFNQRVDAANAEMPWGYATGNTWYRNKHGRVAQNWPFRLIDYWNQTRRPDPGDFEFL